MAKSLNELYTEPAPNTLFPFDLPHEFPLTRSVSTTTDIFSNCSGGFGGNNSISHKSLKTFTPQPQKRANMQQDQLRESNFNIGNTNNYRSVSKAGSRDSLNDMCGITKSILTNRRKSKDELFSEFCKRAGQRPKPKDIYFIDQSSYDDAAEGNVFVVDNYATIRKNRRNSTSNIRKSSNLYNSNQSLKDTNNYTNNKKTFPIKNIFDVDSFGGSNDGAIFLNNRMDNYFSQSRSSSRDSNLYQSRTLPRDFIKRNVEFVFDHDSLSGRRVSASGLYTPYNNSMTLTATMPPLAAPKQFATTNGADAEYFKKSYDPLTSRNSRQCDAYTGSEDTLSVQWPNAIPGSPSSFSNRSQFHSNYERQLYSPRNQPNPQRMSSFYSQHFPQQLKKQDAINNTHSFTGAIADNDGHNDDDADNNNDADVNDNGDEDRGGDESVTSGGSDDFGTFDLDRIEKERRKSHASLFDVDIDFVNGTPV